MSCLPSAAANVMVSSRQRRAGEFHHRDTENTEKGNKVMYFSSCSPLAAANARVSSRQRRAGQGQKKAVKPLANRAPRFTGALLSPPQGCHGGRRYFGCQYAELHKPALAGEPIKSSQANAGGGRKKKNRRCLVAPFYSPPASIGLRTFGGPSANAGWAVWRIDSRNVRHPSFLETLQRKRLSVYRQLQNRYISSLKKQKNIINSLDT